MGVVVLAFAFGLVVPVLVLTANGNNKASAAVGGVHLNAEEQHGRVLFSESCAVCHTLAAANAEGHVGPNLDVRLGSEIATEAGRRALVLNAIAEGRARGLGQMPAGLYQGRDAESIADFLAATAGHWKLSGRTRGPLGSSGGFFPARCAGTSFGRRERC